VAYSQCLQYDLVKRYESIEDTTTAETDNSPVCFPMITHYKEFGSAVYRYIARMPDETDARSIITASPSDDWRTPPGRP